MVIFVKKELENPAAGFEKDMSNLLWQYQRHLFKYMNNFFKMKCAGDLISTGVFPNAKEVTESMGAWNAYFYHLKDKYPLNESSVTVISVGDGCTPRTAALFAFRSNFDCVSLDPNLKREKTWSKIDRLTLIKSKVEDVDLEYEKVLILAVHSHAQMKEILNHVHAKQRSLIAIPCCVAYDDFEPDIEYRDARIWSPKNRVKIWESV